MLYSWGRIVAGYSAMQKANFQQATPEQAPGIIVLWVKGSAETFCRKVSGLVRFGNSMHGKLVWQIGMLFLASRLTNAAERATVVSISDDAFQINGRPTYQGRRW